MTARSKRKSAKVATRSTPKRKGAVARLADSTGPRAQMRHMTVIAQDPGVRRGKAILTAKIAVPAEDLRIGPTGYRLQIVDFDASSQTYYGQHELPAEYDDEPAHWRKGDPRMVNDHRFHAQNTYALVMKTLSRFEFALGRRLGWSFRPHQVKVAPHGMFDANAFYSPDDEGLVFGYFTGSSGATVYTCLSHDIVVHETTHALIDALRERYMDPSGADQAAFHEGLADVIALLSVFALPEVVQHLLQSRGSATGGLIDEKDVSFDALCTSALFGLAEEMGNEIESIRGGALRQSSAIGGDKTLKDTPEFLEAHRRGELFVAAVMRGFISAWSERILKSATPGQDRFQLARVVEEGSDIADTLATMWIRALDYMPPVHLEFSDALSAALMADQEVRSDDSRYKLRAHMIEQFRSYGFKPKTQRKDPLGAWGSPPEGLRYDRVRFESMRTDKDEVFRFIWDNREQLQLRDGAYTEVLSVRPCVRTGLDGFVLRETVVEYYQVARLTPTELKAVNVSLPPEYVRELQARQKERKRKQSARAANGDGGGVGGGANAEAQSADDDAMVTPVYGGGILIFDEYGRVKFWVYNDVFGKEQSDRLEYLWQEGYLRAGRAGGSFRAARLSTLHRLRAMQARKVPAEAW